ncbi:hypothetical protein BGX38DRAFT_1267618 [Terfezia claveryi]|nr:hypothetical protein BGX38DRAFT_1267618 [Terfezia claveryi]
MPTTPPEPPQEPPLSDQVDTTMSTLSILLLRGMFTPPPPLSPPPHRDSTTQTPPPPPPPTPPVRTYAEAAIQASVPQPLPPVRTFAKAAVQASAPQETKTPPASPPAAPPAASVPKAPPVVPTPTPPQPAVAVRTRAIVFHAAPTHRKPGEMARWLEEDNKGVKVAGVRWLLQEGRRLGKAASSLVIYLTTPVSPGKLRMGRKCFRTTSYESMTGTEL